MDFGNLAKTEAAQECPVKALSKVLLGILPVAVSNAKQKKQWVDAIAERLHKLQAKISFLFLSRKDFICLEGIKITPTQEASLLDI